MLIMNQGPYFFADSYITRNPTAEQVAETAIMAADQVRRFGLTPKVALLSYSNFGSRDGESPSKMRKAFHILRERVPDLEVDGEMQADAALSEEFRNHVMPNSLLKGQANLLVFPDLDSANLTLHSLKILGDGLHVGPILVGAASSAHILTPSVTTRGLVNMSAVAAVQAHAAKV
jgi:malate dehydrogenase (oxaloacetate-decarboxylating)(NADP+)